MSLVFFEQTLSEKGEFYGIHLGTQIHAYIEDGVWVAQYGSKKVYAIDKESVIRKAMHKIENPNF